MIAALKVSVNIYDMVQDSTTKDEQTVFHQTVKQIKHFEIVDKNFIEI